MATKAIRITNSNSQRLEGEFRDLELKPHIGYWMLVQFGSEAIDGFISDTLFKESIDILWTLDNGWFDVALKNGSPI